MRKSNLLLLTLQSWTVISVVKAWTTRAPLTSHTHTSPCLFFAPTVLKATTTNPPPPPPPPLPTSDTDDDYFNLQEQFMNANPPYTGGTNEEQLEESYAAYDFFW